MTPMVVESLRNRNLDNKMEYSRILTAAVISAQFRQLLLSNPGKAIAVGFAGEAFNLDTEERNRLSSIRASSLADFASQISSNRAVSMPYSAMAAD